MSTVASTKHIRSRRRSAGIREPDAPRSWEEINHRLSCLGEAERQIQSLRDEYDQKVAVLKQQWLEASKPVEREQAKLEQQVECFYWAHRGEALAEGRKSVELAFGRLGSRRSRSLVVEDAAAAQQWLRDQGLDRFLRIRSDLDREAVRSALLGGSESVSGTAPELSRCPGIHLRESEEFWYEVERARRGATNLSKTQAADGGEARYRSASRKLSAAVEVKVAAGRNAAAARQA